MSAVAVVFAVAFPLFGFPSVAAWAVGKNFLEKFLTTLASAPKGWPPRMEAIKTRRAKGMDARVFLQDKDVL